MFKHLTQKFYPKPKSKHIDRIKIEYGEILSQGDCEAILFFMHPNLKWGGSLNKAVLSLAGQELDTYILENATTPRSGEVHILPPFGTQYKALIMAVLADWDGGVGFEERDLLDCYRHAIEKAKAAGIKRIGIPAMGRDKRDFPHIRFARLTIQGILEKLDTGIDFVKIMCIDHTMMRTYQEQVDKMKRHAL